MSGGADETRLASGMAAAQAGDAAAYKELLRACIPLIRDVARNTGVRPDALDDAVQDCLIAVHTARHTYDPARAFLPWLRAIAKRRAIDLLRRSGRQGRRELHDPIAYDSAADPANNPSTSAEQADRGRMLAAAVGTLPPAQRQAVEHLALRELTLAEAAAVTGRSAGSLKVNLHRALNGLRTRLLDRDQPHE